MGIAACVLMPGVAFAGNRKIYRLAIGDPLKKSQGGSASRKKKILVMAKERVEKRLQAAQVKDAVVTAQKNTLSVEISEHYDRNWYVSLMTSPGRFEIRPRLKTGIDWLKLANEIPNGIEIRDERDDPAKIFLWSASRNLLETFLAKLHLADPQAVLGPDNSQGGWRTYSVGATMLTQEHLRKATSHRSNTGHAFVSIEFESNALDRLAGVNASKVQGWVVVLDGEVLGLVQTAVLTSGRIQLSIPRTATPRDEQRAWSEQVAGRLAAPLPIPIAVLAE